MNTYVHTPTLTILQQGQLAGFFPNHTVPVGVLDASSLVMLELVPAQLLDFPPAVRFKDRVRDVVELHDGYATIDTRYVDFTPTRIEDQIRNDRQAAINNLAQLQAAKLASFPYEFPQGLYHLQLRDMEDKTNWTLVQQGAMLALMTGQSDKTFEMRTEENAILTVPTMVVIQSLAALMAFGQNILAKGWFYKDIIKSSDDPLSVDITTGWP